MAAAHPSVPGTPEFALSEVPQVSDPAVPSALDEAVFASATAAALPDAALSEAQAHSERTPEPIIQPPYTLDTKGNIVAADAFTALAAAAALGDAPRELGPPLDPGPAAVATVQAFMAAAAAEPIAAVSGGSEVSGPSKTSSTAQVPGPFAAAADTLDTKVISRASTVTLAGAAAVPSKALGAFEQHRAIEVVQPALLLTQAAAPAPLLQSPFSG